ncbi:IclR family transcriptional regulator [Vibrio palustris]|uniref:Pectin degradation repressor protein KdgR n=1 Tax=Vibrio palustris TaxID=1918946 RepID=A0A1R4B5X7_9VIBR|nr:IclR family transcriptional regulator [Vibrio palustris]SJL84286.1 Pectin degradation repressor protein KdgR [Vibrio palustris]
MEPIQRKEYRAPALEKGLEILELLACQTESLTKKQIATQLNRSVNEIFRMLIVLVEKQYLEFDADTATYALTLKMFALSNQAPPIERLLKKARPLMETLSYLVNQSCHISRYSNGKLIVIAGQESPYKMGFSLRIGAELDIGASGSGLVLLSFSEPTKRSEILAQQDDFTSQNLDFIRKKVETIEEQGYYVGDSPQISGVTNISVPIFGVLDEIVAVITVPYITLNSKTVSHDIADIEKTRDELLKMAEILHQR